MCSLFRSASSYLLNADTIKHPAAICGDLDSVMAEVLSHYSGQGSEVIKVPDQDKTDLMKCLDLVKKSTIMQIMKDPEVVGYRDVAIFGGLGGRADQAFSILHQLLAVQSRERPKVLSPMSRVIRSLYLITSESIIFCLHKGENKIRTPLGPGALGESVGIIPLGKPATITTKGLEWDVTDWRTAFGHQVSTSNHIRSESVYVKTTEMVLFTVEISKEPYRSN